MKRRLQSIFGWGLICLPVMVMANSPSVMQVDQAQVTHWNQFVDDLYLLHQAQLQGKEIRTQSETGGYANYPDFFVETRYYDAATGLLLSRVQRESKHPDLIHLIEVNVYDDKQQLQRDYLAAYLPEHRNAPIQTLINLHAHQQGLHAFRQFDASGERIYEQCQGQFANKSVFISLDEDELVSGPAQRKKILDSPVYQQCFAAIPMRADEFLQPVQGSTPSLIAVMARPYSEDEVQSHIEELSQFLEAAPANTAYLVQRGNLYFVIHDFDLAILDFTDAIQHDKTVDDAYFGRGMALARNGQLAEGIADLTEYIRRQPESSVAYTKRGVRYLWSDEDKKAEADFRQALRLNPDNAEAHDDLGVIYARRGEYPRAIRHFSQTLRIDPSYIKARHNLAMVYYISGQDNEALANVDMVLAVTPQARDSLLLKAEILQQLGHVSAAAAIKQEAEFLPEGNWSEHIAIE